MSFSMGANLESLLWSVAKTVVKVTSSKTLTLNYNSVE